MTDKDKLLAEAESLGLDLDKRYSEETIREKIDEALATAPKAPKPAGKTRASPSLVILQAARRRLEMSTSAGGASGGLAAEAAAAATGCPHSGADARPS